MVAATTTHLPPFLNISLNLTGQSVKSNLGNFYMPETYEV